MIWERSEGAIADPLYPASDFPVPVPAAIGDCGGRDTHDIAAPLCRFNTMAPPDFPWYRVTRKGWGLGGVWWGLQGLKDAPGEGGDDQPAPEH